MVTNAVTAMRERALALVDEDRLDEAQALFDELDKTIRDHETRSSPLP